MGGFKNRFVRQKFGFDGCWIAAVLAGVRVRRISIRVVVWHGFFVCCRRIEFVVVGIRREPRVGGR